MSRALTRSLAACLLTGLLVPAANAAGAQTTIGFDDLPAGTEVMSQYATLGLRFGRAGELGQLKPTGDCGDPKVATGAIAAASGANYAVLGKCDPAVESEDGSFGALLTPRPSLSVKVQDMSVGKGATVELIGFAAGGEEVAKGTVSADTSGWKELSATATKGAIAYFVVRAETTTEVAIDDLSYETPSAEGEHGTGTTPPPPTPPVSRIALETPTPTAGAPIVLSGAGSSPGSGRIISYAWDFNDDGKIDTSTGTHPTAEAILPPGVHTVGLTVTTSTGEKSSSHASVTVTKSGLHPPDGGEGECLPKLEIGNADLLAECIQKLSSGGYVIAGSRVSINGMVLVLKSGGPLKIRTVKDFAIDGTKTELYGGQVFIELPNTPIGNVVFGERDLEAEPMELEVHSALSQHVLLFHGERLPIAAAADKPSKTFLMAIGIGKECQAGEKKAGCCPPKNALTACATLPGNFPLEGQVDVYLTNKGQALFEVQVGLDLKSVNFEATGSLQIVANLETGIELSSLQFTIGEASLAPIFKVKNASFVYYFPESPEESKRDSWQAKGTLTFGEEVVELAAELAFKKGEFQSASMKFKVAHGGVPIYPGILLNEIGASVGVNPLAFGGSLGASIAELLELELEFKFREATSEELGFFGGKGTLSLKGDQIATLAADIYTDSYVDAQVTFNLHFPFESKEPIIEISGGAGFWDEPASGLWQAKGNVFMKIWIISAEVAGLVNNKYAAGCIHVGAEGIVGGGVQGRYSFEDGSVDGGLYGNANCSDQLKQYSQKPLVKHSGGFVKEESLRRLPGAVGFLAAAGSESFTLPSGTMGQELRITSDSGTPVVTFRSPDGHEYTTAATAGKLVEVPGQFMSAIGPNPHETLVLLRRPKGGEWLVEQAAGSPPIAKLETGEDIAPASVKVHVGHGRGRRYALSYSVKHFVPGTKVRFVERGRDSTHVIGTVSSARGRISFAPQEALGRSRKILAYMIDAEGAVVREIAVGSYRAPGAFRPARVKRLRFVRKGSGALLTWAAVSGARSYKIKIRGSDGRLLTLTRKSASRSVNVTNVLPFETFAASVTAVGGKNLLAGPAAKVKLAAVKPRRPRRKRGH